MTRNEFIAKTAQKGLFRRDEEITADLMEVSIDQGIKFADALEQRGVAPWSDTSRSLTDFDLTGLGAPQ